MSLAQLTVTSLLCRIYYDNDFFFMFELDSNSKLDNYIIYYI
jgi:hypothetical protein